MRLSRRQLLKTSSVGLVGGLAGCAGGDSSDNRTSGETGTPSPAPTPTPAVGPDGSVADLGDTLVYQRGETEVAVTLSRASVQNAIPQPVSGSFTSKTPSNPSHVYLSIFVVVENRGTEPVSSPREITFRLNGTEYPRAYEYNLVNVYGSYGDLSPGASSSGRILFPVPSTDEEGRTVVDFSSSSGSTTGEWVVDIGALDPTYARMELGEKVTFGIESMQYRIGPTAIDRAQSFTYMSDGERVEQEAGQGRQFVLVSFSAENTGNDSIYLPTSLDMRLLADTSEFSPEGYPVENRYEGGTVRQGEEREGVVVFEVPSSASEYEFRVAVTDELTMSWTL